jgi:8-oxo-dGTP pyrophosphatase MutT (NUDIX family)
MHPAATVLLLRENAGELEVLMMRRGAGLAFMGGMWVFPGGRVDAADSSAAVRARLRPAAEEPRGAVLHALGGEPLSPQEALALRVAAARETFEESGVLLASDADGRPCDAARVAALEPRRREVAADPAAFARLLEVEDLHLDLGPLVYWSHWITPSAEPRRFDTRFFAVAVPPGQTASADLGELTHDAWVAPARAEAAIAEGRIRVVPPTLLTLEDLAESHARHGGLAAMLVAERGRPAPPVLPKIVRDADEVRVLMPWDSGYAAAAGDGCEWPAGCPGHLARRRSCVAIRLPPAAG